MVIAALVCFAILLVAWVVAPADGPRASSPARAIEPEPELAPLLEAA